MRISQVIIKNYRNFNNITIVPRKINGYDLVVLIGENNSGKTNILSLLNAILNPERSIRTLNFTESEFYDVSLPIEVEITFDELSEDLQSEFHPFLKPTTIEGEVHYLLPLLFRCTYDEKTKEVEPALVYARNPEQNVTFADKQLLSFYFQDALRDYRAVRPTGGSLFQRILKQIDISKQEKEMLKKIEETSEVLNQNDDIYKFTEIVSKITKRIIDLPDDDDAIKLTVATSNVVDLKKYIQFQIKQPISKQYLEVDELGLGLQSVLTTSIFRAFAGIGKLKEGIFAIDEPEAHLHPHAQRAMFREILELSKSRQVWVATHSPLLLEHIDPRQIILVKKKVNSGSEVIQLPSDFPEEYVNSYEKHLDIGKSDAFFSKAVLLVEGPTEQGLFPAIGQALTTKSPNYDFDRIGVSVINTGGKNNLKTMARLLKNFDIPCYIVIDYDEVDKNHEKTIEDLKKENEYVFEIPRVEKMSDIEGFICLHVPIPDMIEFLQDTLAWKDEMFSELKGAVKYYDEDEANEIKKVRKYGGSLKDIVPILMRVVDKYPESEADIRIKLANGLRKIKGRTTGRLLGKTFYGALPSEFIKVLDDTIKLAGYEIKGGDNDE